MKKNSTRNRTKPATYFRSRDR